MGGKTNAERPPGTSRFSSDAHAQRRRQRRAFEVLNVRCIGIYRRASRRRGSRSSVVISTGPAGAGLTPGSMPGLRLPGPNADFFTHFRPAPSGIPRWGQEKPLIDPRKAPNDNGIRRLSATVDLGV